MSSGGIITFDEFLRHSDHRDLSQKHLTGLTGFYIDEIKGENTFSTTDIIQTVDKSRESLNSSHVSTYIGRLTDDELVTEADDGYRLTYAGLDHYGELVNIPDHSREVRHGSFIEVTDVEIGFYETLIRDINKCYRIGVDDATFVLTRKLIENLVIDLLKRKYGNTKEGKEMFFDIEKRQFRKFSDILEKLEENMGDFEHFSNRLDEEVVSDMDEFRESANSDAHSVKVDRTNDEMERFSRIATESVDILLYVRKELEIAAENSGESQEAGYS